MKVKNPILRGFHPDPSIIRVNDDYYIATSTFEWWPGVRLHHSKDLIHWELMPYPLSDPDRLDLRGVGPSQGIWAPCLTCDKGVFYLAYTVVTAFYCNMYDTANFLVTAENICGPWSEPVPLNNFGFDPSLFHDDDGRKYMVSMVTDHRIPKKYKGRLVLQEYDPIKKKMTGEVREIYQAETIFLEGPHLLKHNGWYYLFSADTGTGEGHGQSILRSRTVWGPYEMYHCPYGERDSDAEAYSILSARHNPDFPLQKCGHCDLMETEQGDWYAVHLCGRALKNRNAPDALRFPGDRRYPLGRETAIQKMEWTKDDWLILANKTILPDEELEIEEAVSWNYPEDLVRDEFNSPVLDLEYQSLRVPMDETHITLTERPGFLRMYGREGLASRYHQTLIARRLTEFDIEVSTALEFEPDGFKQMAGLILLYDDQNYFYLHITFDEDLGKCISILTAENKDYRYPVGFLPVEKNKAIYLKAEIHKDRLQFYWGYKEDGWSAIGPVFDSSILSDEACMEGWFTGAMAGICCQDLTGFRKYADFDWFEYKICKDL